MMNQPEYILTDVFAEVVAAVKNVLALPVLNYQFGYQPELQETLNQMAQVPEYASQKFPLVWLRLPLVIVRDGGHSFYGKAEGMSLFIMQSSEAAIKASARIENVYKPILWPIYREILKQVDLHQAFSTQHETMIKHKRVDALYWGTIQQKEVPDIVDVVEISELELMINHNQNCLPTNNL